MTQGQGQGHVSQTTSDTNQLTLFGKSVIQLGMEPRSPPIVGGVLTTTLLRLSDIVMFLTDGSFTSLEPASCKIRMFIFCSLSCFGRLMRHILNA